MLGFLDFLFQWPIEDEEREQCLSYYREELGLKTLQDRVAADYNNALLNWAGVLGSDVLLTECVLSVSQQMEAVAKEILRAHSQMGDIPESGANLHLAWQMAYQDYAAWTEAQTAAWSASLNIPAEGAEYLKSLLVQSDASRLNAEKEEKKFIKRIGLVAEEMSALLQEASGFAQTSLDSLVGTEKTVCPKCKQTLSSGARYCSECGTKIRQKKKPTTQANRARESIVDVSPAKSLQSDFTSDAKDEWLRNFIFLYEQAVPYIDKLAGPDVAKNPPPLMDLLTSEDGLLAVLHLVSMMPSPPNKEYRKLARDLRDSVTMCLRACKMGPKLAGDMQAGADLATRTHLAGLVGYATMASGCHKSLRRRLLSLGY